MQRRTEFDDFQVTEKNGTKTVLWDLFVVFVFTLMMVKLGKNTKKWGLQEKGKLNLSGKMGDKLGENKSFYTKDSM